MQNKKTASNTKKILFLHILPCRADVRPLNEFSLQIQNIPNSVGPGYSSINISDVLRLGWQKESHMNEIGHRIALIRSYSSCRKK